MLLAQALHEGGAPAGVMNLINGEPEGMGSIMLQDARGAQGSVHRLPPRRQTADGRRFTDDDAALPGAWRQRARSRLPGCGRGANC